MDGREVDQQDPRRDGLVAGSPRDRLLYDPLEHVALIRDSLTHRKPQDKPRENLKIPAYRLPGPIFAQTMLLDLRLPLVDDGLEVRQRAAYRPLDGARPGRNESRHEPSAVALFEEASFLPL